MTKCWAIMVGAFALFGAAPGPSRITMTAGGWSQAPQRWTVDPDGSITDTRGAGFAGVLPFKVVTRHLGPAAGRYDAIVRALAPARRWAGHTLPCRMMITDATRGTVTWGTRTLDYYTGCGDPAAQPALAAIKAARDRIDGWIKDAPIVGERMITTPAEVNNP